MGRGEIERGCERGGSSPLLLGAAVMMSLLGTEGLGVASASSSDAASWQATLSAEERQWLSAHPTIRVAFDGHFPPYSFRNEAGQLEGFAVDMFALLSERTGLELEVSPLATWQELYGAAQRGEVDVVATMVERPDRQEWFAFTKPYIFKSLVIMTRKGDDRIRGKQNLAGKTLAVVKDYQYVGVVLGEFPSAVAQPHDTMLEALNSVSTGNADAAITFLGAGHYMRTKYLMSNLEFAAIYDRGSSVEGIAVRKDWPQLSAILDKALASITESERLALERKWLPEDLEVGEPERLALTETELAWIKAHPVIRLGVDPEFRPFEFIDDDGKYQGHAADYVALLNQRLGLNMEVVPGLTWEQATAAARRGDIDVLPCVGITAERQAYLAYTDGYIEFHRVIITRTDTPFLRGLDDLGGMRVAVQADSSHAGFLADNSDLEPRLYATLQEALMAVSENEVDALVGNIASATYWIRRRNLTNLKVAAAASDEVRSLHFAVRKDWPVLLGILQKGLASISDDKKRELAARWVVLKHDPKVDRSMAIRVVIGAAVVILMVLLWNLQIRRGRKRVKLARDAAIAAGAEAEAANDELMKMQEELEDLVRTRTAELMESEKKFQQAQKMEAMGTLVGGIAHDFNNVLAGMLGSIYLAQARKQDPDAVDKNLGVANSLGFRGADMIKQLLAFARKSGADKTRLEIDAFLEELVPVVRASVPSNIQFIAHAGAKGSSVIGNASLLQQVVLNLVNNARDAVAEVESPRIELVISSCAASEELDRAHPELGGDQFVLIEVIDNGVGIEQALVKRIFDPFFSTKSPGHGTGLGLSMAFGAVRDHGGVIDVTSTPGQGSAFKVYLPSPSNVATGAASAEGSVHHGSGQTLIIADDDDAVLKVHQSILTDLGYRVFAAANGEAAIALLGGEGAAADLAILDVVMPKMDGITAARQMRALHPKLKVIFLSAHDYGRDLPAHLKRSNETLLVKPCSVAELSRTVMVQLQSGADTAS